MILGQVGCDVDVFGIATNSQQVEPGDLFVAVPGVYVDGHRFIADAVNNGAVAVVGELPPQTLGDVPWGAFTYIRVANARSALGWICAAWHDFPSRKMTLVGVTGTDGKTTTVNLVYAILHAAGGNAGMISTVNARVGAEEIHTAYEDLTDIQTGDEIDFVHFGCPHYSIEEIRAVAERLDGKNINPDVMLWVCTTRGAKPMADRMGYTDIIEKAGGVIVCDTCPISTYLCKTSALPEGISIPSDPVKVMVSDSAKQAKYGREMIGCKVALGDVKSCIESALTGKWRGLND